MIQKLPVNQIIPFSNVDGEGNRLSIFVQGCNLNCLYCHNSETINSCIHCGICVEPCPSNALSMVDGIVVYKSELCTECDNCIRVCPHQSTPKATSYTKDELLKLIEQSKAYIRGITISGGEPSLYGSFIADLFQDVKKLGLTCFIDTNGFFDLKSMDGLIQETDGFLFDMKAIEEQASLCGVVSRDPLKNLSVLLEMDKIAEVRTVVLSDFMDYENTVRTTAKMVSNYKDVTYKLIKAHLVGLKEQQKTTLKDVIPTDDLMNQLRIIALDEGVKRIQIA